MKRVLLLATAIVTFFCGVTVSRLFTPRRYSQFEHRRCHEREFKARLVNEREPLRVSFSGVDEAANKRIPYKHRYVIVENLGSKPIRYYVLGFGTDISNVGASAFMTDNGFTYTYPDLSQGPFKPGELRTIPIKVNAEFCEEALVWVDYLEFEDGSAWGPNKSHTVRVKR